VTGEGSLSPSYQVHKEQGTRCLSGSIEIKAGATRHGSVADAEGAIRGLESHPALAELPHGQMRVSRRSEAPFSGDLQFPNVEK
jgi:hypothetical protein